MKKIVLTFIVLYSLVGFSQKENYTKIDMKIKAKGALIRGILFTPNPNEILPVVVIVPGSGRTKKEDIANMARVIFDGLPIAFFVYDKRGTGESTGEYIAPNPENSLKTFKRRSNDVMAMVKSLSKSKYINKHKIGLMGSSQGGWINVMVASRSKLIAFTVCISGAANSVGVSDYFSDLSTKIGIDAATKKIKDFDGIAGFNPHKSLTKLNSPGLWIYGGKDKSNPSHSDIELLKKIKEGDNKDFTIHFYENYNHQMIDETTGQFGIDLIPNLREWIRTMI